MLSVGMLSVGMSSASPDIASLARRARALSVGAPTTYAFDSTYEKAGEQRGWANWLGEGLMLGQYPHCQPAEPGPNAEQAQDHIRLALDAGIDCFVCLQAELPPQDDEAAWPGDGVRLPEAADRARWPAPFVRYAPVADAINGAPLNYLHCPIIDLSVPGDGRGTGSSLLVLLDSIITHYEGGGTGVYMHCWGGRGRAGLVGACLLALMRPELSAQAVLDSVQAGYDSRTGASAMPGALKRSPQTDAQRQFVRSFVGEVRRQGRAS